MLEFVNCTRFSKQGLTSHDAGYLAAHFDALLASSSTLTLNFRRGEEYIGIDFKQLVSKLGPSSVEELLGVLATELSAEQLALITETPDFQGFNNITPVGVLQQTAPPLPVMSIRDQVAVKVLTRDASGFYPAYVNTDRTMFRKITSLPDSNEAFGLDPNSRYDLLWRADPVGITCFDYPYIRTITDVNGGGFAMEYDVMFPSALPGHYNYGMLGGAKLISGVFCGYWLRYYPQYSELRFYRGSIVDGTHYVQATVEPNERVLIKMHDNGSLDINGERVATRSYTSMPSLPTTLLRPMSYYDQRIRASTMRFTYKGMTSFGWKTWNNGILSHDFKPVHTGSYEYSAEHAADEGFWDSVTEAYFMRYGGSGGYNPWNGGS